MRMAARKGFIIIIVVASLAVLMLMAWAIIDFGCGEILNTKMRSDLVSAYYVAGSGAEYMYAQLATQDAVYWNPTFNGTLITPDNVVLGTYTATAIPNFATNTFYIVATGVVNTHRATVIVSYGFLENYHGPVAVGSGGPMVLTGASQAAQIKMDGPAMSNSTITSNGDVNISNGSFSNIVPPLPTPTFWTGQKFDTNNDGSFAVDTNSDGVVTRAEALAQGKEAAFDADNVYQPSRNQIDDKTAFYHYYTTYLNDPANNKYHQDLGITPGGSYHYTGNQSFKPGDIPANVHIIFVDGNVTIDQNDQEWKGGGTALAHTIIATGTLSITQPTNRPGDMLTLVSYGDFYSTGQMGNQGGTIGDMAVYTNGNATLEHGGKMHLSIYALGTLTIDTIGTEQGKDHRMLTLVTPDWTDPNNIPVGLPLQYPAYISYGFLIKSDSSQKPRWQRI